MKILQTFEAWYSNKSFNTINGNVKIVKHTIEDLYHKYKDNPNIFIHIARSNNDKSGSFNKIGLNFKSPGRYNTVFGLCTYPIEYLNEMEEDEILWGTESGGKSLFYIIEAKPTSSFINARDFKPSKKDYVNINKYVKKLSNEITDEWLSDIFAECEMTNRSKYPFGLMNWYIVKLSLLLGGAKSPDFKGINSRRPVDPNISQLNKYPSVIQNMIYRNIGIDYILDDGCGILHPEEPFQAVFLTPNSYKVIDSIFIK